MMLRAYFDDAGTLLVSLLIGLSIEWALRAAPVAADAAS
jgi:hypothetical protein